MIVQKVSFFLYYNKPNGILVTEFTTFHLYLFNPSSTYINIPLSALSFPSDSSLLLSFSVCLQPLDSLTTSPPHHFTTLHLTTSPPTKMKLPSYLIIRIVQAVLSVLVLGLEAFTVSEVNSYYWGWYGGGSSIDNYAIFCSVWSLLVIAYMVFAPKLIPQLALPVLSLGIDMLTALFLFACWIALASQWGPGRCITSGCHTAKAAIAFSCFLWVAYMYTTVMSLLAALKYFKGSGVGNKTPFLVGGEFPPPASATSGPIDREMQQHNEDIDLEANMSTKEHAASPEVTADHTVPVAGTHI